MATPEALFQTAIQRPGIRIKIETYSKAVSARQRLNKWRTVYNARIDKALGDLPAHTAPPRPFDAIQLELRRADGTLVRNAAEARGEPIFIVFALKPEAYAEVFDPDGAPAELVQEADLPDEEDLLPPDFKSLNLDLSILEDK